MLIRNKTTVWGRGEAGGGRGEGEGGGWERGGGKGVGRGGRTQFVHGRSRMTIDPRIPTMPGRSTSGFHQPGRHCLHQARSAVRCSASRMKGELRPSKNRSRKTRLRHLVPTFCCLWMTTPISYTLFSGVATPKTAIGITT